MIGEHASIQDPFEASMRLGGFNPSFVRQVWAKRRKAAGLPLRKYQGKASVPPPVRRRHWTEVDKDRVAGMLRSGLTAGQIGNQFGRSKSAVIGLVHRTPALAAIGFGRAA